MQELTDAFTKQAKQNSGDGTAPKILLQRSPEAPTSAN